MEDNKERTRVTMQNLLIMYLGSMLLVLIFISLKFGIPFLLDDFLDRLIMPILFSTTISIGIWFRMKYELKEISNSFEEDKSKLHDYLGTLKARVIKLSDDSLIYKFSHSISLVRISIMITESEDSIRIIAPKTILKEIFDS